MTPIFAGMRWAEWRVLIGFLDQNPLRVPIALRQSLPDFRIMTPFCQEKSPFTTFK